MAKLWGGRFSKDMDALLEKFNASIGFDCRLYEADVTGSIAYARELVRVGILTQAESTQIIEGLNAVLAEFQAETFEYKNDEDIHSAVERRLFELIGSVAGKLHTGRSRNDQIATDMRLHMLHDIAILKAHIIEVQQTLVARAEEHIDIIMPGYTHMQPAQPILFSHWLMSFFWMLQRDIERLDDLVKRTNVMPLGSAALAGNTFNLDRARLAKDLGFVGITSNSLDAVANRDFIAEFLFITAMLQTHLSRVAEDMVIYSSAEFGFIELDDAFSTGSSIMPQKKNPDSMELVRGKTGRIIGNLMTLLVTLKGTPSSYDKDYQEDKEPWFDTMDTLTVELPVVAGVISTLEVKPQNMQAVLVDELLATDLADYLVRKGMPFRESHHVIGEVVRAALAADCGICSLPLETYQSISPLFEADIAGVLNFTASVDQRDVAGGTATSAVKAQIKQAKAWLETH